jgi:O-antigen/teichoic acid export membrane protein
MKKSSPRITSHPLTSTSTPGTLPTATPASLTEPALSPQQEQARLKQLDLDQIKQRSMLGAISYFGRTLFLQGIGIVSVLVLSAYFMPEDFAIYGIVIQVIGLLTFVSDIGLAAALIQKKDEPTLADYRTAFLVQQLLAWVIVLISLLIIWTGFIQAKTGLVGVWVLLSLAISFPLASLKTISSIILERKLEFSKLVVPQIFEQLVFHGLLIILAIKGLGALSYAYAILARSVVGVVVIFIIQPWKIGLSFDLSSLKSLIGFGVKFQVNDLLARLKDQLFFLVLGFILPLREFGYVQWAKSWSLYPYNLTVQNVMAITFPTFSRLQTHKEALSRAIEKSLFFITLAIFPIVIGMAVFIQPVLELIPAYQKWQPASLSFILFTLAIGWSALSTPLTNTLNAIGRINVTLKLMIMWTLLTWILTPIFLWWFGYDGVAWAALIISLTSLLPVYYVQKTVAFRFVDQVWRQAVAASGMALVGWLGLGYWQLGWSWLILGMALSGLTYGLLLLAFGRQKLFTELSSLRVMRKVV